MRNRNYFIILIGLLISECIQHNSEGNQKVVLNSEGDTIQILNYNDNSALDGWQKEFYENHQLKSYGEYKDGSMHGLFGAYHEDGSISSYSYYEHDTLWYQKRFDKDGLLLTEDNVLTFISPKATHVRDLCDKDSILLSYKLYHSMARQPGLRLVLFDLDQNDTIADLKANLPFVEYYYKNTIKGSNTVLVTLHELSGKDDIMGIKNDTLTFHVNQCK